jgi:hypothetical protein
MSLFFHWLRLKNGMRIGFPFSICGFLLILGLMLFINFYYTPRIIWFVYPAFGAIWWPLAMLYHAMRQNARKGEDAYD